MLASSAADFTGANTPVSVAAQRLPASTVINISAGVLRPSAFSRSSSGPSLSVMNYTGTPVSAVKASNSGFTRWSLRAE